MSDYESIDRTDWRDYATPSELEEADYGYAMDTEFGISDDSADWEAFDEYMSESFDPDDRYGDMRTEPVVFHRIAGSMYRS